MPDLHLVVLTADPERFRGALTLAAAQAALGGRAALFLQLEAVGLLGSMREKAARINAIAEEITRLEEQADELNDAGLKALFLQHRGGNAMAFIVGNEIYDHLEKVADRFEDVANRISGIVIEQV